MTETRLFVYGTLLPGEENHGLLAGARRIAEARTEAAFELADLGGYPALVRASEGPGAAVRGELWGVPQEVLARLDELEEHPDVYRREEVALAGGERAQAYVLPATLARGRPRLAGGDWRAR